MHYLHTESVLGWGLSPKEALVRGSFQRRQLTIGLPKESSEEEARICLTPSDVDVLSSAGHQVWVAEGAGKAANFTDEAYASAGADICASSAKSFSADLVMKVAPPTVQEISQMKKSAMLISALQIGQQQSAYIQALNDKKVTAFAFEFMRNADGDYPIQRTMSEITGSLCILIAAEYLSTPQAGLGILMGGIAGIPSTHIVVLGSGTVAEYAARIALGLGADIQIFDNRVDKLRRIRRALGQCVFTSTITRDILWSSVARADVLIGALRRPAEAEGFLVTCTMVEQMKPGAVILDVSIDQGGCVETSRITSHAQPTFRHKGVVHYCVPNITSRVARTASMALSTLLIPVVLDIGGTDSLQEMILEKRGMTQGIYAYRGHLTHMGLAKRFNIDCKDLRLLVF